MSNLFKFIFTGIIFSAYYFPFEFISFPGINTKMVLAVIGLFLLAKQWLKQGEVEVSKRFLVVSAWAFVFSLFSLFSVTYNETTDYTYASYLVKMWVWLSGAYSVLYLIRKVHGEISMRLVFHYMAWVCAIQSLLSIAIDNVPAFQELVDSYILQDIEFLHRTHRLYGIGAYFDTAGIRFSCALLGLGYLLVHEVSEKNKICYWSLFCIISVLGNVMSRTTTVGLILSIFYMVFKNFADGQFSIVRIRFLMKSILLISVVVGCVLYCYYRFPVFNNYLQYGFEGFVNWIEKGDWSTSSTDKLQLMFVLPDNLKTWLIGDGWFVNPDNPESFYKYTDVGYLRFIFYCGCIGLGLFVFFFIYCTIVLIKQSKEDKFLYLLFLLFAAIVWVKISTDIFLVYALLLLIDSRQEIKKTYHDTQNHSLLLVE